jgi:hypothetical protein
MSIKAWYQSKERPPMSMKFSFSDDNKKLTFEKAKELLKEDAQEAATSAPPAKKFKLGIDDIFAACSCATFLAEKENLPPLPGHPASSSSCSKCSRKKKATIHMPTIMCCMRCESVSYCCKGDQKEHWAIHKTVCAPLLY